MFKIIGIVLLVLIVITIIKNKITENISWLRDDYYKDFKTESELEKKYFGIGEYEVNEVVYKSDDKNIKNIRIWYPKELENSNNSYPAILIVNASNTRAKNLKASFKRLASWGFIVIGNDDLLYQLKNDEEASKVFVGDNAEILSNDNWQDIEKNK